MSEPRPLFRPEAVAYHHRGKGLGNPVRLPAWTGWGYWVLLAAVLTGAALAFGVTIDERVTVTARADPASTDLVATVPDGAEDRFHPGMTVTLRAAGAAEPVAATVVAVDRPDGPGDPAGGSLGRPARTTEVRISSPAATPPWPPAGEVTIRLPGERLVTIVGRMLRGDDGG